MLGWGTTMVEQIPQELELNTWPVSDHLVALVSVMCVGVGVGVGAGVCVICCACACVVPLSQPSGSDLEIRPGMKNIQRKKSERFSS